MLVAHAGGEILDRRVVVAADQDDRHAQALRGGADRGRGSPAGDRHDQRLAGSGRGLDERLGCQPAARCVASLKPEADDPVRQFRRLIRAAGPIGRQDGQREQPRVIGAHVEQGPIAEHAIPDERGPVAHDRASDAVAVALGDEVLEWCPTGTAGGRSDLGVDVDPAVIGDGRWVLGGSARP